jgi:preprotein translocase subunit SecE
MGVKADVERSGMDTAKLAVSAVLVAAGIFGFYHFEAYSTLLRVLGLLAVVGLAVAVIYQTALGRQVWQFAQDSRMEVRKVVWPSRQETVQTTLIVFVMVLIMGVLLWLFDMLLMTIVKALTGQGG